MDPGFVNLIPDTDIPKMLFLAIDPNKAADIDELSGENKISRLLEKFKEALTVKSLRPVRREMQVRIFKTLANDQSNANNDPNRVGNNFENDPITSMEEDILQYYEIFEMFGHTAPEILKTNFEKIITAHKIRIGHPVLEKKRFFVYAENKVMHNICNNLTASDVLQMYDLLRQSKEVEKDEKLQNIFELKLDEDTIQKVPGLKEVAFFYLILIMMRQNMLNRLYSHKLVFILNMLMEFNKHKCKPYAYIKPLCQSLDKYPLTSRPPGICLIFSVHENRPGAGNDLNNVKALFEKTFMYDVLYDIDPSKKDIESRIAELSYPRYKFYDSLVVFFMGHGDMNSLVLKNGETIDRRTDFIEPFTNVEWFQKKPKGFFMQACASEEEEKSPSSSRVRSASLSVDTDGIGWKAQASPDWQSKYGNFTNISLVNTFADTLVSYATMWKKDAARGIEGTLYVETLVDQLREHGQNESIENVLRRVHYNVNSVSLETNNVQWKQTPLLESTLQKAFIFPINDTPSSR